MFERYSTIFKKMFNLDDDHGLPKDASGGDSTPMINLEGIATDDFHSFLSVLSSLHFESVMKDKGAGMVNFVVVK